MGAASGGRAARTTNLEGNRLPDDFQRLVDGMAAALRERPYPAVTVADVVRLAHVSRRTFYQHFASRDQCMIALLRETNRQVLAAIAAAVDPHLAWESQVAQALGAWIDVVSADPVIALSWIRIGPVLGPDGRALSREMAEAYAALIRSLLDNPELRSAGIVALAPEATTMLVGGLRELIATTVEDGREVHDVLPVATDFVHRLLSPPHRHRNELNDRDAAE